MGQSIEAVPKLIQLKICIFYAFSFLYINTSLKYVMQCFFFNNKAYSMSLKQPHSMIQIAISLVLSNAVDHHVQKLQYYSLFSILTLHLLLAHETCLVL